MIPTLYYAIGFIVYIIFNIITFKTYSKKKEMTKKFVLYMIFLFYSLLAGYVISFVEKNAGATFLEISVQTVILILAGGLFLNFFYFDVIKDKEEEFESSQSL
jgi:hypothetical protein